jgi:hypothetical protein
MGYIIVSEMSITHEQKIMVSKCDIFSGCAEKYVVWSNYTTWEPDGCTLGLVVAR